VVTVITPPDIFPVFRVVVICRHSVFLNRIRIGKDIAGVSQSVVLILSSLVLTPLKNEPSASEFALP
jgi:hypothetical protein